MHAYKPFLSVTPFTGFPSASASNSRSVPSCEAVLLALLLIILGLFVPQYDLLCTVVPPLGPRPVMVTWLSRGCVLLRPSLGVSLLLVPIAGTSYLSPSGLTFFLFLLTSSASVWKPPFTNEETNSGRERLCFEWRYINAWLQLQLQLQPFLLACWDRMVKKKRLLLWGR